MSQHKANQCSNAYCRQVILVSSKNNKTLQNLKVRNVVISAGVIGTLELLFKNRDQHKTLPEISQTPGKVVRTNSEAITAVLHPPGSDMTDGTAISTDMHPDENTHVTQNRFDRGYRFMRFLMVPMTDDHRPGIRSLKTLCNIAMSPLLMLKTWFIKAANAQPFNTATEALAGMSATAHVLSGCPMGKSIGDSTIDTNHQLYGYPGIFIVDGSSIPANIGVNPSLTITATAERFASLQQEK